MIHGLSAESPGQVLSIGRWKEQVVAPEFLLDNREDMNRNPFIYEDKRSFRPESLGEQVKRITGTGEDVGLQPRLVTRVRFCIIHKISLPRQETVFDQLARKKSRITNTLFIQSGRAFSLAGEYLKCFSYNISST